MQGTTAQNTSSPRGSFSASGGTLRCWALVSHQTYGLRRGGATHHFRLYGNLESTIFKGRWSNSATSSMGKHAKPIPLSGPDRVRRQKRLRDLRVTTLTLHRYRDAVATFSCYCLMAFGFVARDLEEMDDMAVSYIESCWEECEPKSLPSTTLAVIQHFLQRKRCLPRAWWHMSTWSLFDLPCRAPPLPAVVVYSLVGKALSEGLVGLAAALAAGFASFLRTGEILSLQFGQIATSERQRSEERRSLVNY